MKLETAEIKQKESTEFSTEDNAIGIVLRAMCSQEKNLMRSRHEMPSVL